MKKIIVLLLFYQCILYFSVSCGKKELHEAAKSEYQTIKLETGQKTLEESYTAIIRGRQNVEIRPQISGRITEIKIREGADVKKGQLLFVIDQTPYKEALKISEANVKSAQARLATTELTAGIKNALHKKEAVSDFDMQTAANIFAEAKAGLELALAQKRKAEHELSFTEIKSPLSGAAGMIPYNEGALVDGNIAEPLVTVSDIEEAYVYFSITENKMLDIINRYGSAEKLFEKADIKLKLSDGTEYPDAGRIDAISGTIDENTGTIRIRAVFPNRKKLLRHGGTGRIVISVKKSGCIVIPQSAVYEIQNRLFVYKVADGRALSVPIEVESPNDGKEYAVVSGLKEGDIIVSEGAGLIKNGARIDVNAEKQGGRI